jgi:hypothetical protein
LESIGEILFFAYFIALFVSGAIFNFKAFQLDFLVKKRAPDVWDELGKPDPPFNFMPWHAILFVRYLRSRKYLELSDSELRAKFISCHFWSRTSFWLLVIPASAVAVIILMATIEGAA